MLPEEDVHRVREWIDRRNDGVPVEIRDRIRCELDTEPHTIEIFECRPPWKPEFDPEWTRMLVALMRYTTTTTTNAWSLYWRDSDEVLHVYDMVQPTADVGVLLDEIDRDPTAIFWG
jgi:hypothetical protein